MHNFDQFHSLLYNFIKLPMFTDNFQINHSSKIFSFKNKQHDFSEQCNKLERSNRLQNQRYLLHMQNINWTCSQQKFVNQVNSISNYYTLINTLFAISQESNWRNYTSHMEILISKFHNICTQRHGASLSDLTRISNFQQKLYNILYRNDTQLYEHVFHLIKLLLAYNQKYQILNEKLLSQTLVQTCRIFDDKKIAQTLWTLCQIQVSDAALVNLFKQGTISNCILAKDICLLPFLTILANYTAVAKCENIYQLATSDLFQAVMQKSLLSQIYEICQQGILVCNNILCRAQTRQIILNSKLVQIIQRKQCKQSEIFKQILTIVSIQNTNIKSASMEFLSNSSSIDTNCP